MLRPVRENAPALLVPAAWTVVTGVHEGYIDEHSLVIAHAVMVVLQIAFVAASWGDMQTGVLRHWRTVIVLGIPVTAAGLIGLTGPPVGGAEAAALLQGIALYGWMLLPGAGLYLTAKAVSNDPRPYLFGAALCATGAGLYALAIASGTSALLFVGLNAVGFGQTLGIVYAVIYG